MSRAYLICNNITTTTATAAQERGASEWPEHSPHMVRHGIMARHVTSTGHRRQV